MLQITSISNKGFSTYLFFLNTEIKYVMFHINIKEHNIDNNKCFLSFKSAY